MSIYIWRGWYIMSLNYNVVIQEFKKENLE